MVKRCATGRIKRAASLQCMAVVLLLHSNTANSGIGEFLNFVNDPIGLVRGSSNAVAATDNVVDASSNIVVATENVLTAVNQFAELQKATDEDVRFYLESVNNILNSAAAKSDQILLRLRQLEASVFEHSRTLLEETECAVMRSGATFTDQIRESLGGLFTKNTRVINLPFGTSQSWVFFEKPKVVEVDWSWPRDTFFSKVEEAYLQNLSLAQDNDDANKILSVYRNLEFLARATQCFYQGDSGVQYIRAEAKYQSLQEPWHKMLDVEL